MRKPNPTAFAPYPPSLLQQTAHHLVEQIRPSIGCSNKAIRLARKHRHAIYFCQRKNRYPRTAKSPCKNCSVPELTSSDLIVTNVRHYEALSLALEDIHRVQNGLQTHLSGDFISQDLRECLFHLAEIVGGEITADEVLGNIFMKFCIGK